MGCEFLCCKKELKDGQHHIYLREIRTGFGSNIVIWVSGGSDNYLNHLQNEASSKCFSRNVTFILKSSFELGESYIKSEFFRNALAVCNSFKIITNNEVNNKQGLNSLAGATFVQRVVYYAIQYGYTYKIQAMFTEPKYNSVAKMLTQVEVDQKYV